MNSNQLWLQKVFPGPLWLCLVEQTPLSRCCPEQLLWCSLLLPQHTFTTYTTHTRLYAFLVSLSFVCLWSHQTAYVMTVKIQRVYNYTVLIQLCYLRCFFLFFLDIHKETKMHLSSLRYAMALLAASRTFVASASMPLVQHSTATSYFPSLK